MKREWLYDYRASWQLPDAQAVVVGAIAEVEEHLKAAGIEVEER